MDLKRERYIRKIVDLYLHLPESSTRCSRSDIELISNWYQQKIKAKDVEAAMILATARRLFRSNPQEGKLSPIRSLHYFRPVLAEILKEPLPTGYLEHLRYRIKEAVNPSTIQK